MYTNDFEAAFSDFLETREHDEAEEILFAAMRKAFAAGWRAAGGDPPSEAKIFRLVPPGGGNET